MLLRCRIGQLGRDCILRQQVVILLWLLSRLFSSRCCVGVFLENVDEFDLGTPAVSFDSLGEGFELAFLALLVVNIAGAPGRA